MLVSTLNKTKQQKNKNKNNQTLWKLTLRRRECRLIVNAEG